MQQLYKCDECDTLDIDTLTEVEVFRGLSTDAVIMGICKDCLGYATTSREANTDTVITLAPEEVVKEESKKPEGKRVVRTKSTGDRVYLIDETEKTKAWVTTAQVLEQLGFGLEDVEEVDDKDLLGYRMSASIYKV